MRRSIFIDSRFRRAGRFLLREGLKTEEPATGSLRIEDIMPQHIIRPAYLSIVCIILVLSASTCNWPNHDKESQQEQNEKTRDEVAKETERMKPVIQDAGRKLGEAADRAAQDARAAAQGVKEGWENGSHAPVDLNKASEKELLELPGISSREARGIIDNRPYTDKRDLLARKILPRSAYEKIENQITVK